VWVIVPVSSGVKRFEGQRGLFTWYVGVKCGNWNENRNGGKKSDQRIDNISRDT